MTGSPTPRDSLTPWDSLTPRDRWWLRAAALVVVLLIFAPLLAPGYLLSYDLLFVPRQPLRWDLLAPAAGLPRAVPQDAVVSLLSYVLPGWLLERVFLGAAVCLAVIGAGRLVPTRRLGIRLIAGIGYAWTPFLAERLLLGQWGLLLAYGALPWLVAAAIGVRAGRPGALPRLILAAAVAALTPTGGLIAFGTVVVMTVGPRPGAASFWRVGASPITAVALLNLPWLIASVTTAAGARSDPAGVTAFAVRAENWSGPFGAILGTGGIWNAQTTPTSRASVVVPLVTLVLLGLAGAGVGVLWRRWGAGDAARLLALAVVGVVTAALGVVGVTARVLAWSMAAIPGAGLLRDGQKFLLPYALVLAVCLSLGVERLVARLAEPRARLAVAAALLLPVALLPDLAFGGWGQLRPVAYPRDWDRVAAMISYAPGEVLSLPFSEYRRYPWNRDRIVIDPAPRYLPADVVSDDTLRVGDLTLNGESPRAAGVRAVLASGQAVAVTGVAWVLVQRDSGTEVPVGVLAGLKMAYHGESLDLYANPQGVRAEPAADGWRRWVIGCCDLGVFGVVIAAIWCLRRTATPW